MKELVAKLQEALYDSCTTNTIERRTTDRAGAEYLTALSPDARQHLEKLHATIRAAAPAAVESFSYGIPAFRLDGKGLVWYAAWKQHSSIYPFSTATTRVLARELRGYETSGKGTVRFRLDEPIPTGLVKQLVRARIAELRGKKKSA